MQRLTIEPVDLQNCRDGAALLTLLDAYACDPMGGGRPLDTAVRDTLVERLAGRNDFISLLAWSGSDAVGLLNAFEGFSTFKGRPLINIHDVYVLPAWRGRGVVDALFKSVAEVARERNCCKLTLEVLEGNRIAQAAYRRLGFDGYQLAPATGRALFWERLL